MRGKRFAKIRLPCYVMGSGGEENMKTLAAFPVCLFIISFLPGCVTHSLWDQEINHKMPEREITVSGNEVHFQAKETIRYPFWPFHWTSEQNHDRIFTASSGTISEWSIETDPQAPRFSEKFGLPLYLLPEKCTILRPGDPVPGSTFLVSQARLKIHPDDIQLLQKPFLFQGYAVNGKQVVVLQIPVSFQSGKLKCCLPEGSEIATQADYVGEPMRGLPFAWNCLLTPVTVAGDIVLFPVFLAGGNDPLFIPAAIVYGYCSLANALFP